MTSTATPGPRRVLGWREWVGFPDWGVDWMKVKVDTGARTSALHAGDVERIEIDGRPHVRFTLHPWQRNDDDAVEIVAPLVDRRDVTSSSGDTSSRSVVTAALRLGDQIIEVELTLARRDELGFRMLLGREAMRSRYLVDPGSSYLLGRAPKAIRRRNRRESPDSRESGSDS